MNHESLVCLAFTLVIFVLANSAVHAIDYESLSYSLMYKAESAMYRLEGMGMKSDRIRDLVNEAKLALSIKKYELSVNASAAAIRVAELAENTSSLYKHDLLLIEASKRIGINTSAEQNLIELYSKEFERSNYEKAYSLALQVSARLEEKLNQATTELSQLLTAVNQRVLEVGISSKRINSTIAESLSNPAIEQKVLLYDEARFINRTITCVINTKSIISGLQDKIMTPMFNHFLEEELALLEIGEYQKADEICSQSEKLSKDAEKAYHEFTELNNRIRDAESKKVNVDEPKRISGLAREKLDLNQIEQARQMTSQGLNLLEQRIADDMLFSVVLKSELSFSVKNMLVRHWLLLVVVGIIVSVSAVVSLHGFAVWNRKRVHKNLVRNEAIVKDSMKKTQKKYYVDKKMTKDTYESQMDSLQLRLVAIREKLSAFEGKEKKITKQSWMKLKFIKMLKYLLTRIIEYEEKEKPRSR